MSVKTYGKAINEAIDEAMALNQDIFNIGEDIEGGQFGVTYGLWEKYGSSRIRNTPISESALVGIGVGASLLGCRPIVEIMFADCLAISMDHIVNSAAKMRYLSDGKVSCPLVVRAPMGLGLNMGMHHSQCPESWFANVPGIIIVAPSSPYDAKGLMHSAIESNDPVVFLEHKILYWAQGEVPDEYYKIPLGKGEIKRNGDAVTIIATARMVYLALEAAGILSKDGIEVEIVDPRTIRPLDKDIILDSVRKTGKALIVHEASKFGGIGGEIASIIAEEALDYLQSPIVRLCGKEYPVPFGLEEAISPKVEDIVKAVEELVR